jgi:hypothetical protein
MTTERRKMPRLRTLLGGRIVFNQRRATLDCVVRNFSDAGALVLLSDAVALPAAFDLEIDHKQRSYGARVRWRSGERIGIVFEDQPAAEAEIVPLDIARRLKLCEQNNAQLKARIQQLTQAG